MIDQVVFASSADHAMTPGVKVAGQIRGGKFVPFDTAAAGSPVEQLMPAVTAGIGAYGAIEAAKETRPDVVNVDNSNSNTAKGGDAWSSAYSVSHGGNQWQIQSQQQLSKTEVNDFVRIVNNNNDYKTVFNSCKPMSWKGRIIRKGCGY